MAVQVVGNLAYVAGDAVLVFRSWTCPIRRR